MLRPTLSPAAPDLPTCLPWPAEDKDLTPHSHFNAPLSVIRLPSSPPILQLMQHLEPDISFPLHYFRMSVNLLE